jgi:hypothetical protein
MSKDESYRLAKVGVAGSNPVVRSRLELVSQRRVPTAGDTAGGRQRGESLREGEEDALAVPERVLRDIEHSASDCARLHEEPDIAFSRHTRGDLTRI